MSPIGTPTPGAFPLTSAEKLPNVTVAYPGERWSDRKAIADLDPGEAVIPVASADGTLKMHVASAGDAVTQLAVATRPIDVPDTNPGSIYNEALGPNEIRNRKIAAGDYILAVYSGVLHLTLIVAAAYQPGDLIGWVPAGVRQTGKTGVHTTGAWGRMTGANAIGPLFEVVSFRTTNQAGTEGVLTVRSLRGQGPF